MYDYLLNSGVLFLAYFLPVFFLFIVIHMILNTRAKLLAEESDLKKIKTKKQVLRSVLMIWVTVSLFLGFYAPSHTPKRSIDVTQQEKQVEKVYEAEREASINSTKELKDRLRTHKETHEEREDRFQDMVKY